MNDAVIDQAVLEARTELYSRLGATKIGEILAEPFTETPTTDAQLLIALGATTEIKIARRNLFSTLNPLWMEGSGSARHSWNETPLARQQGTREIEAELERLNADIDGALGLLSGAVAIGNDTRGGFVALIEPTDAPPLPGRSVWPRYQYLG